MQYFAVISWIYLRDNVGNIAICICVSYYFLADSQDELAFMQKGEIHFKLPGGLFFHTIFKC